MGIRKRGRGHWQIRVQYRGIRIEETVRGSKAEATRVETAIRSRLHRDTIALETGGNLDRTYGEAVLRYIDDCPASMKSHLRCTLPYLKDVPMTQVPAEAYRMRQEMIELGYSPCTINRRLSRVRRILNLAYTQWRWLSQPLAQELSSLSEKGTARLIELEPDEVRKIMEHCGEDAAYIIKFSALTGMRQGEVFRLVPEDYRDGILRVRDSKNGLPRSVPVPDVLEPVRLPMPLTRDAFRGAWEDARKAAGMEHVRLHDLRHSYGSMLASDPTVPLIAIRDVMGHKSIQTTNKYVHIREAALRKTSQSVGQKWVKDLA